jgi:hypothetical protein
MALSAVTRVIRSKVEPVSAFFLITCPPKGDDAPDLALLGPDQGVDLAAPELAYGEGACLGSGAGVGEVEPPVSEGTLPLDCFSASSFPLA